jgi:hypothetical protein
LESGWEVGLLSGAGDGDLSRLQWFAKHLEHAAVEFRELVQEQDSLVREGDLPRSGMAAAAH